MSVEDEMIYVIKEHRANTGTMAREIVNLRVELAAVKVAADSVGRLAKKLEVDLSKARQERDDLKAVLEKYDDKSNWIRSDTGLYADIWYSLEDGYTIAHEAIVKLENN